MILRIRYSGTRCNSRAVWESFRLPLVGLATVVLAMGIGACGAEDDTPLNEPERVYGDSAPQEGQAAQDPSSWQDPTSAQDPTWAHEASGPERCNDDTVVSRGEADAMAGSRCHHDEAWAKGPSCHGPCHTAKCACCFRPRPACPPVAQPEVGPLEVVQIQHDASSVEHGDDALMIDGDPETYVTYKDEGPFSSEGMYIWFSLNDTRRIEGIDVHWRDSKGQGTQYATHFFVGFSADDEPGPPSTPVDLYEADSEQARTGWSYIEFRSGSSHNTGGRQFIDLSDKLPLAQHVALWLAGDARFSIAEMFSIAEVTIHPTP